ncbi:MAG: thiol:disulfide interchange protein [Spirosomataceae bacterium]|jgi:thiol:disulfide interchange protein DsbD
MKDTSSSVRHILSLTLLLFTFTSTFSQVLKPATWSYATKSEKVAVGDVVDVVFEVTLESGWYIYSNDFDSDLGPILTTIDFNKDNSYELIGKLRAINPKKKFDEIWDGDITYFTKKGQFVQRVKILKEKVEIKGIIDYQTCTIKDGSCIPGKEKFNYKFEAAAEEVVDEEDIDISGVEIENTQAKSKAAIDEAPTDEENLDETAVAETNLDSLTQTQASLVDSVTPAGASESQKSLWEFLLLAFLAGVASIFMPCIYPIMPMTVSFFTKQTNGTPKVVFYGISIMAIFAVIGLVTMAFGAPFLNFISTHWIPNLLFFFVFILFGMSLFGAFEIVLPHEAVNKIDRMSDRGGFVGIFFMALTLVVVSFSCTVPFVGSLLILAAGGEVLRPLYGMLAFGLPFALVFTLLATFPQFLKNLPKSGGWLNELKVVFGFLEFALALKFLSNIDLAYRFNLLHRNIFLVLWIVIFVLIGVYILGYLRLPKDSPVTKRGFSRIGFAVVFFVFAAYMIPGTAGRTLPLLSGILPPMQATTLVAKDLENEKMHNLPHGLQGFHDFDDALAYAKTVNKPVLIDFTGYACANCRKMEENVWPEPAVLERMQNNFVIASLYVDDKTEMLTERHYVSSYDDELKTTVGEKNMDLEITKFNNNAQPYYAIVDTEGKSLVKPLGYVSTEEFIKFLDRGKAKFVR